MSPLVEKKQKQDGRSKKQSFAFYLSKGFVDDLTKVARETGRSKSEVLEILALAGLRMHRGEKPTSS